MESKNIIEQYKILIDIYYKELTLLYSKITIFTTIQLGVFIGVVANYTKLLSNLWLFGIGVSLMLTLSVCQILISKRGNTVNEALINTIAEFEGKYGYTLLMDFSLQVNKINKISKMNFPSYIFIYFSCAFIIVWFVMAIALLLLHIDFSVISIIFKENTKIEWLILIFISILYAVTMKIADLLDEHGISWFKGDRIVFGVLCGMTGCFLIVCNDIIANIIFAMVMGFVIRKRIDYTNHIVAFIIITSSFIIFTDVIYEIYFTFLFSILVLGSLKDLKYLKNKSNLIKIICKVYLYVPIIYAVPSLVYSLLTNDWIVFAVFFTYDLAYNVTRLIGEKNSVTDYCE